MLANLARRLISTKFHLSGSLLAALALSACAGGVQEPAQPSIASTTANLAAVASLPSASPAQVWEVDAWATQAACDSALDAGARKNSNLTLAGGLAGFAGPAAVAFGASPLAAIASSTAAGLFSMLQSTGIQYTAADTVLIRGTMAAYRQSVAMAPPATVPQALQDSEQYWWLCSIGGQQEAQELSKMSARPLPAGAPQNAVRGLRPGDILGDPDLGKGIFFVPAEPGVSIGGHRL